MALNTVSNFGGEVTTRVQQHVTDEMLRRAYRRLHRKAALVATWYVASYVFIWFAQGWIMGALACVSLALSMVAVGFNIQHDANHNAFFRTKGSRRYTPANRIAGLSINAIGASRKRWIDGHVYQHHKAPNVVGKDADVNLGGIARLAPAQRRRAFHAFQHFYLWVVYGFTTGSVIVGDVIGTVQDSVRGVRKGRGPHVGDYAVMALSKGLFAAALLVIPLLSHPWWTVLIGAVVVLAISGWLLGVVFQLAHVVEEADFSDTVNPTSARWHEWQVRSSVDFCHGNGFVARAFTWYAGGLNYQTEHHLFPDLPHTIYPEVAPIVAEVCAEYDIPYQVQPTLRAAVRSHYRHVRELGRPDSVTPAPLEQAA